MDWIPILTGLLLVHGFIMIWCFTIMNNRVQLALFDLDRKIAGAIKAILDEGIGQMEPINPLQSVLAQLLMKNQNDPGGAPQIEIIRDDEGKFR